MRNNQVIDDYNDGIEAKALNLKSLTIGLLAILVFIGIVVGIILLNGVIFGQADTEEGTRSAHPVVYVKDNALMVLPAYKKTPYKVSDKYDAGSVQIAENGSKIYYTADGMLYSKKTNSKNKVPKEIAKVTDFKINKNGKNVLYRQGEALYSGNSPEKIADGVLKYFISSENDKVIFETAKGVYVYDYKAEKGPVELVQGIGLSDIVTSLTEYRKICYLSDGDLYYKAYKKEPVLLGKNIENVKTIGKTTYAEGNNTLYAVKNKKLKTILTDVEKTDYPENDKYIVAYTDSAVYAVTKYKAVNTGIDVSVLKDVAFSKDGKYMYTIETNDVYKYKMKNNKIKQMTSVIFNAKEIECYDDILIVRGTDDGYFCYAKKQSQMLSEEPVQYKCKDGVIYFLEGTTLKKLNTKGSFKVEEVATNVNIFDVRSKNYIIYGRNANIDSEYALYLEKGIFDLRVDIGVSETEIYERELEWNEKAAS